MRLKKPKKIIGCAALLGVGLLVLMPQKDPVPAETSIPTSMGCGTVQNNDSQPISSKGATFYVPRSKQGDNEGISTIIVPIKDKEISFHLLIQSESGIFQTEKQQLVVLSQTDEDESLVSIDFSPQYQIGKGKHVILVVKLPISVFSKVTLIPTHHPTFNTIGVTKKYPVSKTLRTIKHPFLFLNRELPPYQALQAEESKLLSKTVQPGDLLLPSRLVKSMKIEVSQPANINACPPSIQPSL